MTEPVPAGRGALAQVIATRGGLAAPEAPFVIEHREALIYMLCEAAELEHAIMCQYLYAAFSLKRRSDEGLADDELAAVDGWRRTINHIASQEMLHLALVQNLLAAVGSAPHLSRPNLPQPAGHYPPGVVLTLIPFGEAALQHFMYLERPEGMDLADADGLAAAERSAPLMAEGDIVPRLQDFATVGHLYRSIEEGFRHLSAKYGEEWLFVGPPRAQATEEDFNWPELVQVTDATSAQLAIDTILEQGEGPRGHWRDAHFGQFVEILDEYTRLTERNPAFQPARPVLPATVRPCERDRDTPLIGDALSAKCTDLFNVGYEVLLQTFERYFAHTEESDAELATLARVTLGLMFNVIKPIGELITELPVGEEHPGRTAGPSFELFYESDYLLPHRDAAWALIEERLREASAFADRLQIEAPAPVASRLEPVAAALLDLAHTLAAGREKWGGSSHTGEVTVAHRRREAEAMRSGPNVQELVDDLVTALRAAIAVLQERALRAVLAAAALKADTGEGELDDDQLSTVRSWRRGLLNRADHWFDQLRDLADVLVAVNGASDIEPVRLEPRAGVRPVFEPPVAEMLDWLRAIDENELTATWERIREALVKVPAAGLVIDPHVARRANDSGAPGGHVPSLLVDRPSVAAALDAISSPGDLTDPVPASAGPPKLSQIIEQLEAADREAGFQPVRPGALRRSRSSLGGGDHEEGDEALAGGAARLFVDGYETLLAMLGRGLSGEVDPVGSRDRLWAASTRLWRSVLRPLAETLAQVAEETHPAADEEEAPAHLSRTQSPAHRLRALALDATRTLSAFADVPPELIEATAALQGLAVEQAEPADVAPILEEIAAAQARIPTRMTLLRNGPCVATNIARISNWLGEEIIAPPAVALCRCGASATKPFCDGSHARIDFSGAKDPRRVGDRRDTYEGFSITVFDNRGICQHSGYCTDALPVAFRTDQEPFVAPSGAGIGEIIRAVRSCPSGALSFAIDGHEARSTVDWHGERPPGVLVTKDGPYRVTGGVPLLDETGEPVALNDGASLEHYALCRCGHSQNKPFCSGMHWYVGFRDPIIDSATPPTMFEWCGGLPALERTTRLFYERYVPDDPLLAPLFASMPSDLPERTAAWLGDVFGGPPFDGDEDGDHGDMFGQHAGRNLSEDERARWVELLCGSGREAGLPTDPEFWSAFTSYLEWQSRAVVANATGAGRRPPAGRRRWGWGPAGPPPPPTEPADEESTVETLVPPGEGEPVSFAGHIKVLFRESDRRAMSFGFDLWSYDDVRANAQAIASRLVAGDMPCDAPWPAEKTELFQRWVEQGTPP